MSSIQSHVKAVDVIFWRKGHQGQIKDTSENLLKQFCFFFYKKICQLNLDHNKSKNILDGVRKDWMRYTSKIWIWRLVDAKQGNKKP